MALYKIIKDGVSTEFNTQAEMATHIANNSLVRGTYEIWFYMGEAYKTIHPGSDGWDQVV
jgi:hypothetical protein